MTTATSTVLFFVTSLHKTRRKEINCEETSRNKICLIQIPKNPEEQIILKYTFIKNN